ncbi:uncharacterized protein LOC114538593 [Dendronephthya gigantea]|uniref:uncharacterized protein LOC114538593 n=1 Tax=Dendronephthya gigantea TaxID=151771 RepID=UPI00106B3D07|nr:uncharacterized protein LOC114538593 [Dendronephthya gigantea]
MQSSGGDNLLYYRLFVPEEIKEPLAEFSTGQVTRSTTQLRIGPDNDGEREKVFKIKLLDSSVAATLLPSDEDIAIVVRLGSAIIPNKRDPLYVMISDDYHAIGFKISESGPIKGAEGTPGKYLDPVTLRGDDNETKPLNTADWPDEFVITLRPKKYWGSIFCSQGNGNKQCVGYGHNLHFRNNGMFLDVYRHAPIEEYIINYIEVKVFANRS